VSAYKQGESNIIIYCKNSRRILDVFRVSVESSLILPESFYISIDTTVELFKNDPKKQAYIKNLDAQWTSSKPNIVEISKNGILTAHREGVATIKLENYSGSKFYLTTDIYVSSLNSLKIELGDLPSYFTPKKSNSQYRTVYK
jgi:hypothetical protein